MGTGASFSLGHRGPRRVGAGASSAFGSSRPPSNGRGGLFRFEATEAPAVLAQGPPVRLGHRGPSRISWIHSSPFIGWAKNGLGGPLHCAHGTFCRRCFSQVA